MLDKILAFLNGKKMYLGILGRVVEFALVKWGIVVSPDVIASSTLLFNALIAIGGVHKVVKLTDAIEGTAVAVENHAVATASAIDDHATLVQPLPPIAIQVPVLAPTPTENPDVKTNQIIDMALGALAALKKPIVAVLAILTLCVACASAQPTLTQPASVAPTAKEGQGTADASSAGFGAEATTRAVVNADKTAGGDVEDPIVLFNPVTKAWEAVLNKDGTPVMRHISGVRVYNNNAGATITVSATNSGTASGAQTQAGSATPGGTQTATPTNTVKVDPESVGKGVGSAAGAILPVPVIPAAPK